VLGLKWAKPTRLATRRTLQSSWSESPSASRTRPAAVYHHLQLLWTFQRASFSFYRQSPCTINVSRCAPTFWNGRPLLDSTLTNLLASGSSVGKSRFSTRRYNIDGLRLCTSDMRFLLPFRPADFLRLRRQDITLELSRPHGRPRFGAPRPPALSVDSARGGDRHPGRASAARVM